LKRFARHRSC